MVSPPTTCSILQGRAHVGVEMDTSVAEKRVFLSFPGSYGFFSPLKCEWLWAILSPSIFLSYHLFLYLLCSSFFFPFFFLFLSHLYSLLSLASPPPLPVFISPKGMLGGIWGWEGRRLGGLKRSNSVGDHCQAQILEQRRNCLGRKGDAKERIQNKKDNPRYNSNGNLLITDWGPSVESFKVNNNNKNPLKTALQVTARSVTVIRIRA